MTADEATGSGGPEATGSGGPEVSERGGPEAARQEPPEDPAAAGSLPPPSPEEVRGWDGCSVEDIDGVGVAKVSGCFVDADSGAPAWLLARLGRFGDDIAIPLHDCAAVAGKVWVPYHRDVLRDAPVVDPARPLNRDQELAICEHFGVVSSHGRAAEVSSRAEGAVTSRPPS